MKLLVTTDFHGAWVAFEKTIEKAREAQVDAVIICGDITHFGSVQQAEQLLSLLLPLNLHVLFVSGNTDPPQLATARINGTTNLHATCQKIGDYNFIGVGAPHPTFEVPEGKIGEWLKTGATACAQTKHFVIVAHVPPKNTKVDLAFLGGHVGSLSLRQFIVEKKPLAVLCGHIHEARGVDQIEDTLIVNPGPARKGYYALLELTEKVDVEMSRF
ncbi:MAG: metallophosphoesterase family protein [Candidatus Bathyarchaeales archaeon]